MRHSYVYCTLVLPLFYTNINMQTFFFLNSFHVMWPTDFWNRFRVYQKYIMIKKIMIKKFSNVQEVNILLSSNVNFSTILSHVLDSDSEVLKMFIYLHPTSSTTCSTTTWFNSKKLKKARSKNTFKLVQLLSFQVICAFQLFNRVLISCSQLLNK